MIYYFRLIDRFCFSDCSGVESVSLPVRDFALLKIAWDVYRRRRKE